MPEQILAAESERRPIHSDDPWLLPLPKSLRADWTDASRTQERMSPRQAKSRVVNSDRKRSDGRHDIGYARSGVGSGTLP